MSHKGDQYTFIALASSAKAIVSCRTGKRDSESADLFVKDLRQRILGVPEIIRPRGAGQYDDASGEK
ncbi:hypothetical protein ACVWZ4_005047 [Bradyrhizobium sp. USDA 4472]